MKMCRKYPVSLEQYRQMHLEKHGDIAVKDRYIKAKYFYSCLKYPFENGYNTIAPNGSIGKIKKPEDVFKIWWDV